MQAERSDSKRGRCHREPAFDVDEDDVGLGERRVARDRDEVLRGGHAGDERRQIRLDPLDRAAARVDGRDALRLEIHTDHPEPGLRQRGRDGEADVTEPDHADDRLAARETLDCRG